VERTVDPVAQGVGRASGQGAVGRAQDDPQQDVVLPWPDAEAITGRPGKGGVRRRGEHGDLFDQVGVRPERLPNAVAEGLCVGARRDRHRQVAANGRQVGHRAVRREVEHLG
jgi:hypothetical protein